jgi:hypothetical protein
MGQESVLELNHILTIVGEWVPTNVVQVYHLFGYIYWIWIGYVIYFILFFQINMP